MKILSKTSFLLAFIHACFWAYWGVFENFHEGWFERTTLANLKLMTIQYLSPFALSILLLLTTGRYPRIAAGVFLATAISGYFIFHNLFVVSPLLLLSMSAWFGQKIEWKWISATVGLPCLFIVVTGFLLYSQIADRYNDSNFSKRTIVGNGVTLTWAPRGPGFPMKGCSWNEAADICSRLSEDGLSLGSSPVGVWRLPTADEAVRSLSKSNKNSFGILDMQSMRPTYQTKPDKESPVWDIYSPIIYYWTSTEVDSTKAFIIVYNGQVVKRSKNWDADYLSFRAVKSTTLD